ncbi:hypothetical protein [Bacteroides gallinarum]|jgi:hypothetical protein|uniref:hypothetical protein n=1 Tax=Bacteroides gallinarum TaxID=376806 RepID=UPI000476024B|nr:hypothetical protein [Bacteroides gallinarum]
MDTEVVNAALQTGKGISDFGMMAITAGFFLVLSALLMVACFRWFMNMVNQLMTSQKEINQDYKDTMRQLLEETRAQNERLNVLSESLMPETQLRIKTLSNVFFDLSVEKVCRIIKKVREENHISDKEATARKIRTLLTNIHEDRNSKLDCFSYRGNRLSEYTERKWIEQVAKAVEAEIYNENGANNGRAYTNVESVYANIRLEFYHNLNER